LKHQYKNLLSALDSTH